jgi:uroporphyrinogen-III synthase
LTGRRVLLTREEGKNEDLARRLARLGAEVRSMPATATAPSPRPETLLRLAAAAGDFDWIVFASARGVEAFAGARRERGLDPLPPPRTRIAAVGPATARALEELGRTADLVPSLPRAEGLVAQWPGEPAGLRILLPRPLGGRRELTLALRSRGATVREVTAYRTLPLPPDPELLGELAAGLFDALLLLAPSAAASLARGARKRGVDLRGRLDVVAVGPTTAEAARSRLRPRRLVVAAAPTSEGIEAALLELLASAAG